MFSGLTESVLAGNLQATEKRGCKSLTHTEGKWVPAVVIVIQLKFLDACKHCCKYSAWIDSHAPHSIPER